MSRCTKSGFKRNENSGFFFLLNWKSWNCFSTKNILNSNQCLELKSDLVSVENGVCFFSFSVDSAAYLPIIGGLFRHLDSFWNADMAQAKFHADHIILCCLADEFHYFYILYNWYDTFVFSPFFFLHANKKIVSFEIDWIFDSLPKIFLCFVKYVHFFCVLCTLDKTFLLHF